LCFSPPLTSKPPFVGDRVTAYSSGYSCPSPYFLLVRSSRLAAKESGNSFSFRPSSLFDFLFVSHSRALDYSARPLSSFCCCPSAPRPAFVESGTSESFRPVPPDWEPPFTSMHEFFSSLASRILSPTVFGPLCKRSWPIFRMSSITPLTIFSSDRAPSSSRTSSSVMPYRNVFMTLDPSSAGSSLGFRCFRSGLHFLQIQVSHERPKSNAPFCVFFFYDFIPLARLSTFSAQFHRHISVPEFLPAVPSCSRPLQYSLRYAIASCSAHFLICPSLLSPLFVFFSIKLTGSLSAFLQWGLCIRKRVNGFLTLSRTFGNRFMIHAQSCSPP